MVLECERHELDEEIEQLMYEVIGKLMKQTKLEEVEVLKILREYFKDSVSWFSISQ
tara:strand:- start:391 stop:558 length:168 start_codon:yes stop_codon:yes gene_type:complete